MSYVKIERGFLSSMVWLEPSETRLGMWVRVFLGWLVWPVFPWRLAGLRWGGFCHAAPTIGFRLLRRLTAGGFFWMSSAAPGGSTCVKKSVSSELGTRRRAIVLR